MAYYDHFLTGKRIAQVMHNLEALKPKAINPKLSKQRKTPRESSDSNSK